MCPAEETKITEVSTGFKSGGYRNEAGRSLGGLVGR